MMDSISVVNTALLVAIIVPVSIVIVGGLISLYNYLKHRQPKVFRYIGDDPCNKELSD